MEEFNDYGKALLKYIIIPFIIIMFIVGFVVPGLSGSIQPYTLNGALNYLAQQNYIAWAATGLTADQVLVATGTNTVGGYSGLTYNSGTQTFAAPYFSGDGSGLTGVGGGNITGSSLASGQVVYATGTGSVSTDIDLTYDPDTNILASGGINVGSDNITFGNLILTEGFTNWLTLYSALGNYAGFACGWLQVQGNQRFYSDNSSIRATDTDDNYFTLQARDSGVGLDEVARVQGAADPYMAFGDSQSTKFYNSGKVQVNLGDVSSMVDGEWHGTSINMTAGANLAAAQLVRIGSDGKLEYADASDNITCHAVYITLTSANEDATTEVLRDGVVCFTGWSFAVPASLWVSATSGNVTDTAPASSGDQLVMVGNSLSSNVIDFRPSWPWGEVE